MVKKSRDKLFSTRFWRSWHPPNRNGDSEIYGFHFLARFGRVAWPVRDEHIQREGGGGGGATFVILRGTTRCNLGPRVRCKLRLLVTRGARISYRVPNMHPRDSLPLEYSYVVRREKFIRVFLVGILEYGLVIEFYIRILWIRNFPRSV